MKSFYHGKKVLVAGGGGFIGSHLVDNLVTAGADVRVVQRHYPEANLAQVKDKIEFIPADLSILENCVRAVRGMEIVFDLAARVGGVQYNISHPATMFFTNSNLALNVLEAARREGVVRFMCVSSTCVYSPDAAMPNLEEDGFLDDPDESNIGYGWSKRVAEMGARLYAREYGMKIAIARPANVYGPRDNFDAETFHVIPALIKRVFEAGDTIEVWGDGRQTRAFGYVKDAADAMMLLAERYAVADPINVGTDEEVTIRELIELIVRLSGRRLNIKFDTSQPQGQVRKVCAVTRMKEKLGWSPAYSLERGLEETIAWYRKVAHR
ncbi:MAG TPA: NAD-dependent epimerase/dehydratase family protein [Dehalococcoidales bacterium]|nr:MAG: hypothetical protein A2Z05_07290 [Chloroflexi bacterium RBG_16_60_22]HJX13193.1 NAD-dependent epimerase/dehydratase family protein [Dehalococcoidales bacterium]